MSLEFRLRDQVNSEIGLRLLFFGMAVLMLLRSFEFREEAQWFPQITASIVIIGVTFLSIKNYLPQSLQQVISKAKDTSIGRQDDDADDFLDDDMATQRTLLGYEINPSLFAGAMITLYIVFAHLFSILLMSPIFAFFYTVWFDQKWYVIILVTLICTITPYLFVEYLRIPVDSGVYWSADLL